MSACTVGQRCKKVKCAEPGSVDAAAGVFVVADPAAVCFYARIDRFALPTTIDIRLRMLGGGRAPPVRFLAHDHLRLQIVCAPTK